MFRLMREIRGKNADELADFLTNRLDEEPERFITNDRFSLHQMNRPYIHWLLARMTDFVETQSGQSSHILQYLNLAKEKTAEKFEVEHVWANHFERHTDEFKHPVDFQESRNRIGGLLLLPKSFNASFGDLPFDAKAPHYYAQNLLASSLYERCYVNNPRFVGFYEDKNLPFEPYAQFTSKELQKRQRLYQEIAESLWNPARITEVQ